jgi:quercetin dioxygenase-like cupin family protein
MRSPALVLTAALLMASAGRGAEIDHAAPMVRSPQDVVWGSCPPALPAGCKLAVLAGDPTAAVPFTIRFWLPDGYRVAPHSHPTDENVTVVSGTLHAGMGDTFDAAKAEALAAGGFTVVQANMNHYVWFEGDTVLQIHGTGPFAIAYVNPADDPRTTPPTNP